VRAWSSVVSCVRGLAGTSRSPPTWERAAGQQTAVTVRPREIEVDAIELVRRGGHPADIRRSGEATRDAAASPRMPADRRRHVVYRSFTR